MGRPSILGAGEQLEPESNLRSALAYYLAWCGGWVARDRIANLFWSDRPQADAYRNLRQLLYTIRHSPLGQALEIQNSRVAFVGATDVETFFAAIRDRDWHAATRAWNGVLLDGFAPPDSIEYTAWLEEARAELCQAYVHALNERSGQLESAGDLAGAAKLQGRVWRLDALDAAAIERELLLLHQSGNAAAAAAEARAYREAVERELEIPPTGPLASLIETFEAGRVSPVEGLRAEPPVPPASLPSALTRFIGRRSEVADLTAIIEGGESRLISVVGIGGVGKTRLILEVGHRLEAQGKAVRWAPLVSVASPGGVRSALALSCGVAEPSGPELVDVARRIGDDRVLLLVDNAEHVLDVVRDCVDTLLRACRNLTVLISSRIELGLPAEHVFSLGGLHYAGGLSRNDAMSLFVACARRRDRSFQLEDHEAAVAALCREVGGLPLALELVASWAAVLTPEEMLSEVRSGVHEVRSMISGVPERHRSLSGVLDGAWERLSPEGRDALIALAPCRGGFDLHAAETLGATRSALTELVSHALLRRAGDRFGRHPLVWRYARDRAKADPDRWASVLAGHGRYYLGKLRAHRKALLAQEGTAGAQQLYSEDAANLLEALRWSVEHEAKGDFLDAYFLLRRLEWCTGSKHDEHLALALQKRANPDVRAHLALSAQEDAIAHRDRGSFQDARGVAERALAIAKEQRDPLLEVRAISLSARAALAEGERGTAESGASRALAAIERSVTEGEWPRGRWTAALSEARAHSVCAALAVEAGRYREARRAHLNRIGSLRRAGDAASQETVRLIELDLAYGNYGAAFRAAQRACLQLHPEASPRAEALYREARGLVMLARGWLDEGRKEFARALAIVSVALDGEIEQVKWRLNRHAAHTEQLAGDLDAARNHLEHVGSALDGDLRRAHQAWLRKDLESARRLAAGVVSGAAGGLGSEEPRRLLLGAQGLLSRIETAEGRLGSATEHALASLDHARQTGFPRYILGASMPAIEILARRSGGRSHEPYLDWVAADSRTDFETRSSAHRLRSRSSKRPRILLRRRNSLTWIDALVADVVARADP